MGILDRFKGGKPVNVSATGYDVFLVAGQSNAQGAGVGAGESPDDRVHQFAGCGRSTGRVVAASDPLLHQQKASGVGFGMTFAKLYAEAAGRPVLLVPAARGSSGFHPADGFTWDRHDTSGAFNLYDFAAEQLAAALATHPNNKLAGILWHQGENDARNPDGYAAKLDALIAGLRERFGMAPFILGQMSPDRMAEAAEEVPGYPAIDAVHRDTPNRHPAASFVEAPAGLFNSETEKIHFNAAGQQELGRRYFSAFQTLTAGRASLGRAGFATPPE